MGDWNLNLDATGTHSPHVPDADQSAGWASVEGRSLIARLLETGHDVREAILTHWPGQPHEVRENLLTGEKTPIGEQAVAAAAGAEPASAPISAAEASPAAPTEPAQVESTPPAAEETPGS